MNNSIHPTSKEVDILPASIVKKKEKEDKDNSRFPLPQMSIKIEDLVMIGSLCMRHNE